MTAAGMAAGDRWLHCWRESSAAELPGTVAEVSFATSPQELSKAVTAALEARL